MSREEEIKDMEKSDEGSKFVVEVFLTPENTIYGMLVNDVSFESKKLLGKKLESVKVNDIELMKK